MPLQPLSQYTDTPIYNIKAVEQATGVAASTLRVWERRYGVPTPNRSDTGYRLYSERDIATVTWLKGQLDEGLTISQAIARLDALRGIGEEPAIAIGWAHAARPPSGLRSLPVLQDALVTALLDFHATRADDVLSEAFALYPVEAVALSLIQPTLIEIGEGWHRGDVSVAQEHFASAYLRARLDNLFNQALHNGRTPSIVCACVRGELHEIGLLMLSLFLRRRNYNVLFLGANVPTEQILQAVERTRAVIVCVSASTLETGRAVAEVGRAINALPAPRPLFGFGGRIFNAEPALRDGIPGAYLGEDALESAERIIQLLED
ncbi:MAG: cobalamin-dependent protein [Anaerolineae bacterium]